MSRGRRRGPPPRPVHEALFPTLDLHGQTAEEAERAAERWLIDQQRHGEGIVRVITGRGRHSVGPPVLPTTIEDLLKRLQNSIVRSHEQEAGGGAFRVQLFRPAPRPAPHRQLREEEVDPELLLDAQRSLSELGIMPTPALVRLEVERIVKKRRGEAI
jgi:hypothetical protein